MVPEAPNAAARSHHHEQSPPKTRPTKSPALERTEQHTHSVPWTRPELRVLEKRVPRRSGNRPAARQSRNSGAEPWSRWRAATELTSSGYPVVAKAITRPADVESAKQSCGAPRPSSTPVGCVTTSAASASHAEAIAWSAQSRASLPGEPSVLTVALPRPAGVVCMNVEPGWSAYGRRQVPSSASTSTSRPSRVRPLTRTPGPPIMKSVCTALLLICPADCGSSERNPNPRPIAM
jgi:hypothetical protein